MARREILVILACFTLVYASEAEESEQKKRGAGKTTLNAIPTGAQKPEYTYNIYSQNPSTTSSATQTYQTQHIPNSFYPNQGNQYYVPGSSHTENVATQAPQQLNFVSPQQSSQFVPLNFIPNPGYQTKYQLAPPKSNGNIQLAIIQQPSSYPSSAFLQYPQSLFSPSPTNQITHPNPLINSVSPGQFNFAQSYQPLSIGNPYLGHPSAMVVVPQASPPLYNSLLYPNSGQNFYNYYPSNSQTKFSYYGATPSSPSEYDKGQSSVPQSITKEENDISVQNTEYITPADASTGYKNAYSGSRGSSYSKLN